MDMKIGENNVVAPDYIVEGYSNKIKNQIYKTLPLREEGKNWEGHIDTLMLELTGASSVLMGIDFISLVAKLSILRFLDDKSFRKTIFECCGLVEKLMPNSENKE